MTSGATKTPYQIARELGLVGGFASGKRDVAQNRKRYLKRKLRRRSNRSHGNHLTHK